MGLPLSPWRKCRRRCAGHDMATENPQTLGWSMKFQSRRHLTVQAVRHFLPIPLPPPPSHPCLTNAQHVVSSVWASCVHIHERLCRSFYIMEIPFSPSGTHNKQEIIVLSESTSMTSWSFVLVHCKFVLAYILIRELCFVLVHRWRWIGRSWNIRDIYS